MKTYSFDAVIFDLDGVITKTALVHAAAWKTMFDEFLQQWSQKHDVPFVEFQHAHDYLPYVDGRPRYDGVEAFLRSRGINLPYGDPNDNVDVESVCGLGNRKNQVFNDVLQRDGVEVFQSTVDLLQELKDNGVKLGVASSSKNCKQVLERANLLHFFQTRVDGVVLAEQGIPGKPAPDIFIKACDNLKVDYSRAVIVEDAVTGVQAGRKGNFGLTIGLAREENEADLRSNGADIVLADIEELGGISGIEQWFTHGLMNDLWSITFHRYQCNLEKDRESLLSIGNRYFNTRGALEESKVSLCNSPATHIANLLCDVKTNTPKNQPIDTIHWHNLTFKVSEDDWFDPNIHQVLELSRTLHFRSGTLEKRMVVCDDEGRETLIESKRMVNMANVHQAAIEYSLTPLNYQGYLRVKSELSLAGFDQNQPNKHIQKHLIPLGQGGHDNYSFVHAKTAQSAIELAAAARLEVLYMNQPLATNFRIKHEKGWVNTYIKAMVKEGETLTVKKLVSMCDSHNYGSYTPMEYVTEDIKTIESFSAIQAESMKTWETLWKQHDTLVDGDRRKQKLLRLRLFHSLISTTSDGYNANQTVWNSKSLEGRLEELQ